MKKSLIKIVSFTLINILFITLLSAISLTSNKISNKPILVSDSNAKIPGYENPFEEIVVRNSDKVRDLMLEFDTKLGNNKDFPNFYSGSYYSYDDKENITGMIFALTDSEVSYRFADIIGAIDEIEYIEFQYVKYSYNELADIQNKISDEMSENYKIYGNSKLSGDAKNLNKEELFSNISQCAIDMKNNCIIIEVIQLNNDKKQKLSESLNDIISSELTQVKSKNLNEIIIFKNIDERIQFRIEEGESEN